MILTFQKAHGTNKHDQNNTSQNFNDYDKPPQTFQKITHTSITHTDKK